VPTVDANGVALGVESFGDEAAGLVLLAGGTTMHSWPDAVCERLAAGGRRVVRYDLRDSGESTTTDPQEPAYTLRDLAADAAALVDALGGGLDVRCRPSRPPQMVFVTRDGHGRREPTAMSPAVLRRPSLQ
jgi:pimeloyl-ACP methyl ester carboxylesterase